MRRTQLLRILRNRVSYAALEAGNGGWPTDLRFYGRDEPHDPIMLVRR